MSRSQPKTTRARARTVLLRLLLLVTCTVLVASVACGSAGDEPGLLGLDPTPPDAAASSTATATATATASAVTDSGPTDSGPGCPTLDILLVTYGLAPACGPCIDNACASVLATCNAKCSCPTAAVGFVQCISLGASASTCAAVAGAETDPAIVLGLAMCSPVCQSQCHLLDGGDDGDAGDSGASAADAEAGTNAGH
jgi:hypothetical protein